MEYIVKQGDNLWSIAQSQLGSGLAYKDILKANNLREQDRIYPGQKLNIPHVSNLERGGSNKKLSTYTIKAGDSLSEIARDNNISLSELAKLNNISNPNRIQVGQVIQIPKSTLIKREEQKKGSGKIMSQDDLDWIEYEINKKSNIDIINYYHRNDNQYYLIDDKMESKLHLCKNGKILKSYRVLHSAKAKDDDEMTTSDGNYGGNLKFPAGIFYVTKTGNYHNLPAYIRRTPKLFENNSSAGIANSIHVGNINDPRGSNGCTRMLENDMKEISKYIGNGNIPCYILPANLKNYFFIRNGELQFHSSDPSKVAAYNTIKYMPIENITYNKKELPKRANTEVIDEFSKGLINYKERIQEDLGINSDTYNKLAKAALGILGVETTFGKKNNDLVNIGHGILKAISQKNPVHKFNTSSPDYKAKYEGIAKIGGANKSTNSIGLTQIRLSPTSIHQEVLDLIKNYGITADDLVYNPLKAAAATMLILAYNYKNMGQDVSKAIKAYNNKPTYLLEVGNYSKLFSVNIKA